MSTPLRVFKAEIFQALAHPTRIAIVEALRNHRGRVMDAAQALRLSRATLYRKIKLLKIELDRQ